MAANRPRPVESAQLASYTPFGVVRGRHQSASKVLSPRFGETEFPTGSDSLNHDEDSRSAIPRASQSAPRLELLLTDGTSQAQRISCTRVVTLLGCRAGCTIVLNHRKVSPVHAAILNDGHQLLVVDLVTPEGTLLNGKSIDCAPLRDGDRLRIGTFEFLAHVRDPLTGADAPVEIGELEHAPSSYGLEHLATSRVYKPNRKVCIIGRVSRCDLSLKDLSVSRRHALLFSYRGHPAVLDLATRNGTLVNDLPVSFALLSDSDVLSVGATRFRIRVAGIHPVPPARSPSSNGLPVKPGDVPVADLVDIRATESASRWRIADHAEKSTPRRQ